MTYRAPRHPAMVDFHQHQERLYVVLEEDHEKVEKRAAQLEAVLREIQTGKLGYSQPMAALIDAALAGQQQPEPPFAARLREAGPQIAAEVDRMMGDSPTSHSDHCEEVRAMAATPAEDGREVLELREMVKSSVLNAYHERATITEMADAIVAQHERIVAAKEAEIARLRDEFSRGYGLLAAERDELRAAQPARQVGGFNPCNCGYSGELMRERCGHKGAAFAVRCPECNKSVQAFTESGLPSNWNCVNRKHARQVGGDEREAFEAQRDCSGFDFFDGCYWLPPVPGLNAPDEKALINADWELWQAAWSQSRAALAPAAVMPDGYTPVKTEAVLFLLGLGTEPFTQPDGKGKFWWRQRLHEAIPGGLEAMLAQQGQEVGDE